MGRTRFSGPVKSTGGFEIGAAASGATPETDTTIIDSSGGLYQAGTKITANATELNYLDGAAGAVVAGIVAGYKIARGSTSVTGTADITTELSTVVQAVVSLQDDVSLEAFAVSVINGGTAGHITAKVWKPTSSTDCTPAAATVAKTVRWIAIGT